MQWCRDQGATVRTGPWTGNVCAGGEGNINVHYSMNLKGSREVGLGSAHVKAMATGTHAANVNCHLSILLLQAGTRVCTGRTGPRFKLCMNKCPVIVYCLITTSAAMAVHRGRPASAPAAACHSARPPASAPRRCWAVLAAGRRLRLEFKPAICMDSP